MRCIIIVIISDISHRRGIMKKSGKAIIGLCAFLVAILLFACDTTSNGKLAPASTPSIPTTPKAEFTVGRLELLPASPSEGQVIMVFVPVTNNGNADGKYSATLKIDGKEVENREISLVAGATRKEIFEIRGLKAGTRELSVGDSRTELKISRIIKIVYCAFRTDTSGTWQGTTYVTPNIYISNDNGTNRVNVTDMRKPSSFPDFSPDGTKICFQSNREWHQQPRVYTMNSDGTGVTLLTKENFWCEYPSWSPDGSLIAYTRNDLGVQAFTTVIPGNIWVVSPDGENSRMISIPAPGIATCDRLTSWFPDSKSIAFESNREGFWQIYIQKLDGSPERVTQLGSDCHAPAVSPDGKKIAYSSNGSIYVMDLSTKLSTKLTDAEQKASFPSWHPDGNSLIYTTGIEFNLHGWTLLKNLGLYSMNSDGTNAKMITFLSFEGRYQK